MKEFLYGLSMVLVIAVLLSFAQVLTDPLNRDTAFILAFIFGAITSSTVDLIGSLLLDRK